MKFYCLALLSVLALSLIGCNKDESLKPEDTMSSQFEQAKKDGTAGTPPPSKSGSKKADLSKAPEANVPAANAPAADNKPN